READLAPGATSRYRAAAARPGAASATPMATGAMSEKRLTARGQARGKAIFGRCRRLIPPASSKARSPLDTVDLFVLDTLPRSGSGATNRLTNPPCSVEATIRQRCLIQRPKVGPDTREALMIRARDRIRQRRCAQSRRIASR